MLQIMTVQYITLVLLALIIYYTGIHKITPKYKQIKKCSKYAWIFTKFKCVLNGHLSGLPTECDVLSIYCSIQRNTNVIFVHYGLQTKFLNTLGLP